MVSFIKDLEAPLEYKIELNDLYIEYKCREKQIVEKYNDGFRGRDDRASRELFQLSKWLRIEISKLREKHEIS